MVEEREEEHEEGEEHEERRRRRKGDSEKSGKERGRKDIVFGEPRWA